MEREGEFVTRTVIFYLYIDGSSEQTGKPVII
jgi:hypothetical protein